jgi:hypothetical protein
MQKEVKLVLIGVSLILILSISFVSAGFFSDLWSKITGQATTGNSTEGEVECILQQLNIQTCSYGGTDYIVRRETQCNFEVSYNGITEEFELLMLSQITLQNGVIIKNPDPCSSQEISLVFSGEATTENSIGGEVECILQQLNIQTCSYGGVDYVVKRKIGCEFEISYDGITEKFTLVPLTQQTLQNGVNIKKDASPCNSIKLALEFEESLNGGCLTNADCDSPTPFCITNQCVSLIKCVSDDACPSYQICDKNGVCVNPEIEVEECSLHQLEQKICQYNAINYEIKRHTGCEFTISFGDKSEKVKLVRDDIFEDTENGIGIWTNLQDCRSQELVLVFFEIVPKTLMEDGVEEQVCNTGCILEDKCVPICYRTSAEYCSLNGDFIEQLRADGACNNNCECESNLCVDGQCVSSGLIQKILNWFRRLFSGE